MERGIWRRMTEYRVQCWLMALAATLTGLYTGRVFSMQEEIPPMQIAPLSSLPRSLPPDTLPPDQRLGPLRDLNSYFPFTVPASPQEWDVRAAKVRRRLLVSLGLWPLPARTPLNAVIHGTIDRGDYTVEKVFFESLPGFFVTGNLYWPKERGASMPAVLCPHGHWPGGRFYDLGEKKVREEIEQGAERFVEGGRSPLQARCVQLARMGCVAFLYDMIGYADCLQIPYGVAHGFNRQRPEMNSLTAWGLFSPQAEEHCQNVMGLQAWNSIRALDFLSALPGVDTKRLAVTGASGGGTQTFILCAIDPRPALAFPAVMVSTAMQGGCTCENACGLRIGTGNVEFAALFAPKPLGLTSANDWTKEMSTKGFPELQQLYAMLGAEKDVMLARGEQFGHNYNNVSREAFYRWINLHFGLGFHEPVRERDYRRLSREEATVWDASHPSPPGGPEVEKRVLRHLTEDTERQLRRASESAEEFRSLCAPAWEVVIGRTIDDVGVVHYTETGSADGGGYRAVAGLVRQEDRGECVPITTLVPKDHGNGRVVVCLTATGKDGLFTEVEQRGKEPLPWIVRLLSAGYTVVGADLMMQGEFLGGKEAPKHTRKVNTPRQAAAYTLGYNPALFARRVHDALTVLAYVSRTEPKPSSVDVVGLPGAGHWAAAAGVVSGGVVSRLVLDTAGFRFGLVRDLRDPDFLPGGAKYGDLPGLLALRAPGELRVYGDDAKELSLVAKEFALTKAEARVTMTAARLEGEEPATVLLQGRKE